MRIWIDTEFNDYRGYLISIALVAEDGRYLYEVLDCENPSKWVAEHVMPALNKNPIVRNVLQIRIADFLANFNAVHIIADWPDDIRHFCDLLITGPGRRISTPPLTMEIRRDIDSITSLRPHNALEDARAIMRMQLEMEAPNVA